MKSWDLLALNLGLAWKGIRRSPGHSAAIVATLALGIGANATMFQVIDRLFLQPPAHVQEADQLRHVFLERKGSLQGQLYPRYLTYPDFMDIRDLPVFESAAGYSDRQQWIMGSGTEARKVRVVQATSSLFSTLGAQPAHGRFYDASQDRPDGELTAVISEEFWTRSFGRDPEVLGRVLELNRGRYPIVGVAPAGFTGAELRPVDIWVALRPSDVSEHRGDGLRSRTMWWVRVVARLKEGASDRSAAVQMTSAHIAARRSHEERGGEPYLSEVTPRLYTGSILSGRAPDASTTASISLLLAGVSAIVLLIACANVANLLLARGVQQRRQLAIRSALGAGRKQLMAQSLAQALSYAALGALAALVVAQWSSRLVQSVLFPDIVFADSLIGPRLVVFVAVATLTTALFAGVLPALQAGRVPAADALRSGSRGNSGRRSRLRDGLTVGQVALSVVLLAGAGLFVKSLRQAAATDVGFDFDHTLAVTIKEDAALRGRRPQLYQEALPRVTGLPGVRHAAILSETLPLSGYNNFRLQDLRVSGHDAMPIESGEEVYKYSGTEGFAAALGMQITRGRGFLSEDFRTGSEPIVLVNESFARRIWPQQDPLAQCVAFLPDDDDDAPPSAPPCRRVVGIYQDIAVRGLTDSQPLSVAWPKSPDRRWTRGLIVRAQGDPSQIASAVREAVLSASSGIRYVQVSRLSDRFDRLLRPWRLGAAMFTAFGVLALAVAAVGLYSVLAFGVAQRRREIGIRTALGAQRQDLVRLVAGQSARFTLLGLSLGTAIALAGGRFADRLLFGVDSRDPWVHVLVVLTLAAAGCIAAIVPSLRAASVSPTEAMQSD